MVQNQTKKCPNGSGITRSPGLVPTPQRLQNMPFIAKLDNFFFLFLGTAIEYIPLELVQIYFNTATYENFIKDVNVTL